MTDATGRVLRVANALLFVVLAALVGALAPQWLAARTAERALRAADAPPSLEFEIVAPPGAAQRHVDVSFSRPVAPPDRVGEAAPDGLVRLEPDVGFRAMWATRRRLRVIPDRPFPPARRIHVHVDAARAARLAGADRFGAAPQPWFETPGIERLAVVATDHDATGTARALVLSSDLDLHDADVARWVSVHAIDADGEAAAPLAVHAERLDTPGEHAWRLALEGADLPDGVIVRVHGALTPRGGDVPLGAVWEQAIDLRPELQVVGVEAYPDGVGITLSHEVPLPAEGTLRIDPPVAFQVHRRWGELRLYGELRAGTTYRLTLEAGFPGDGAARLRETVTRSVRLPDHRPQLDFPDRGTVLSSVARPEIAVSCLNVSRIEVAARTVYANNVVRLTQDSRSGDHVFGPWTRTELAVAGPRNERSSERVDLAALLSQGDGAPTAGLHEVRVRDLGGEARTIRRLVQVTDLGVTVRAAPDALAVRVTSIAHGRPVADAAVSVRTPTNQLLCSGTTAADGTALLRFARAGDDRVPYLVDVHAGADRTFVDLEGFAVDLAEEAQSGRAYLDGGYECLVHPDRGAVRPGEEVRATVVGRSARGVSPVGAEVDVRWIAPDRGVRATERLAFDDSGLLVVRHTTSTSEPTGAWRVEVADARTGHVVGSAPVVVEAFVPDRIEASVEVLESPVLGTSARVRVRGAWLEGAPATGQELVVRTRLDDATWCPQGRDGFSFGPLWEDADHAPPGALPAVRGVLDDDGTVDVAVALPDGREDQAQGYRVTVQVEVADPSGRPVRAGTSCDALVPGPVLGVRAAGDALDVVLVDADGEDVAAPVTAEITLERRHGEWRLAERTGRDGRRHHAWEPYVVAEPCGRLRADLSGGAAGVPLPELRTHRDWVVAVARVTLDGRTQRADVALGGAAPRPDRLRVEGPAQPVRAGEDVELVVASPVAGTAFVTLESTTIHGVATAEVARGRDVLKVRIPEGVDGPNVHAVVTVVAPQARADTAPPWWIVGGASVALDLSARATDVAVRAPDEVLPGGLVEIGITAPGATHATVALVDEGILRITGHRDPDPRAFFGARRRLATRGADTGCRLLERPGYDPDALDGGDQNRAAALAERLDAATAAVIETVALFSGPVALDDTGRAIVRLTLPEEYEGRVRAVVVAAGPDRVGAASAEVRVRAPLGLRVAAPRRLAPGDAATATVTLRNGTGADAVVDLTLASDGGIACEGEAARRLVVPAETVTSFDVTLTTARDTYAPEAALTVGAVCGGERRTVRAVVPVQPAGLFAEQRAGVDLAADAELRLPGSWAPGTRRARVVIAPGVGSDLLPALRSLLAYPHGCVEQTSSRAHAVLACRPLLRDLSPDDADRADGMIRQGIARLRAMQTPRGGMAFWPGGRDETDVGGLAALDFLLDAHDQGFYVEPASLRSLVRRLEHRLGGRDETSFRAMTVEILSRGGAAVGPWLADLATRVTRAEDRARVAMALVRIGDAETARALLDRPSGGGDETGTSDDLLFSETRQRAFLLRALLEVAPADARISVLADALRADTIAPDRLTTQAQSHAVRALAALHLRNLPAAEPVTGTVTVDGVPHAVDGRTAIDVPADARGRIAVSLSRPVRALVEVRGVRIDDDAVHDDGSFRVTRSYVDADTGREVTQLRRGGLYDVVLRVRLAQTTRNLLVTDLLPAGLEAVPSRVEAAPGSKSAYRRADHQDVRDDRVLLHVDGPLDHDVVLRYRANAVFPGRYAAPPPVVEALYVPGSAVRGTAGAETIEVLR